MASSYLCGFRSLADYVMHGRSQRFRSGLTSEQFLRKTVSEFLPGATGGARPTSRTTSRSPTVRTINQPDTAQSSGGCAW
jgi:hypothetical protein